MRLLKNVHTQLTMHHRTVAVAESCTGGLLAKLLTDLPGSSAYFIAGVVSYHDRAKTKFMGIPARTLARHGAVSQPVACAMAKNIRSIAQTDIGMGITGIAGPGGGAREKPVGTVYVALATKKTVTCKKFKLTGSRAHIRNQAALRALELLARQLSCAPLLP